MRCQCIVNSERSFIITLVCVAVAKNSGCSKRNRLDSVLQIQRYIEEGQSRHPTIIDEGLRTATSAPELLGMSCERRVITVIIAFRRRAWFRCQCYILCSFNCSTPVGSNIMSAVGQLYASTENVRFLSFQIDNKS